MGARGLAGRTVLLTGVTGFLGTAVLEKVLRSVPDCRILALVRPGRAGAERRLRDEVLASRALDSLRTRLGADFERTIGDRVTALAGDLGGDGLGLSPDDRALMASVDVVIHSAAEVAFDSALDVALRTNLEGSVRLLEAVLASGARPSVVQVSTAYVSGIRRGLVMEGEPGGLLRNGGPLLDWRRELRAAEAVRAHLEGESRSPRRMRRFAASARRGPGASGIPARGAEAERLRARWVDEQLVAHGRAHARGLGWSDVYTMSKALAELAVAELCAGRMPLSVVRPSIIESALVEPFPGWISGLRMAEPIILAFGRGLLPEFPGLPDGILDLVPVDIVANAVIAAAAAAPASGTAVYHVSTGARNPLRMRGILEHAREYFIAHPLHDAAGAPIPVPYWTFPSGLREARRLRLLEGGVQAVLEVMERGPATRRTRDVHERLEEVRDRVKRGRALAEMYAIYTEMDAVFDDSGLRTLDASRPAEERAALPIDVARVDWREYLQDIHIPAVIELARLRRRAPRPVLPRPTVVGEAGPDRGRLPLVRRGGAPALAIFDVEATIAELTVVQHYLYFLLDREERRRWPVTLARAAARVPGWVRRDRASRLDFQRHFYRGYAGLSQAAVSAAGRRALHEVTLPRCYPGALRRVREHVDAGHRVVLVTGALEEVVRPLAELLEVELRAARLRVVDGRYDGDLADTPPSSEARGALVRRLAAETGAQLADCYAYADSISDLSMLEVVGHPVPVNPDLKLLALARRRGWPVQIWTSRDGGGRLPVVLPADVNESGWRPGLRTAALR